MTEDKGSLWMACWEPFTPGAAAPVLRLLRQTFKKVARGPKAFKFRLLLHTKCGDICVCVSVSLKPEKSLLSG